MPQVCLFKPEQPCINVCRRCLLLSGWRNDALIGVFFLPPLNSFMSHCRHFCPLFSSPAALLPLCFATALFTLFKILPLPSPLCNILSFLPFLSPDQFSFPYPFPFSQPLSLRAPSSFPPFFDPSTPLRLSCVCASLLFMLPVLAKWQKEAVGGPS